MYPENFRKGFLACSVYIASSTHLHVAICWLIASSEVNEIGGS